MIEERVRRGEEVERIIDELVDESKKVKAWIVRKYGHGCTACSCVCTSMQRCINVPDT